MAKAEATVEELVGMIERGELRLPEMQRRFVWRSTRVRDRVKPLSRTDRPGITEPLADGVMKINARRCARVDELMLLSDLIPRLPSCYLSGQPGGEIWERPV